MENVRTIQITYLKSMNLQNIVIAPAIQIPKKLMKNEKKLKILSF